MEDKKFYAVERFVDGFGADTWVDCIFENEFDAYKYVKKLKKKDPDEDPYVVACKFGEPIKQCFG